MSTFKVDLSDKSEKKEDLEKEILYSIIITNDDYVFMKNLLALKARDRNFVSSNKTLFLEGFELLKSKNIDIKDDKPSKRRYYRGGQQKIKDETISTSVKIKRSFVYWIDNYIFEKRKENIYYSKPQFISELINELRLTYGKDI